jgi:ribosomal protein L37E
MQAQASARTGVKKCPICHTENMMEATRCAKCGYVFPDDKGARKLKDKSPFSPVDSNQKAEAEHRANWSGEQLIEEGQEVEEESQIPKAIYKEGQKEGLFKLKGQIIRCPRCDTEYRWYLPRCPICGYKNDRVRK